MNTNHQTHSQERAVVDSAVIIAIGFDLHTKDTVGVMQIGQTVPKPARKVATGRVLGWIQELQKEYPGAKIHTCYEAGPCGYWLHRQLLEMGVSNVVVAPVALNGKRKTDQRDARQLCERLVRYVGGDRYAFSVVAVPSPEVEKERALIRHRQALLKEKGRCTQRGRSLARLHGYQLGKSWWGPRTWKQTQELVPAALLPLLEQYREQALLFAGQIQAVDRQIADLAKEKQVVVPRGVGALTALTLRLEMVDWTRFQNRRQVASYTGLCPGEYSSGGKRRELSIDKHGNRRVRRALIVASWRLERWQPGYRPLERLRAADGKRARKRAVVAVARRLAIDLWRLATGQTTAEKLGLTSSANPLLVAKAA